LFLLDYRHGALDQRNPGDLRAHGGQRGFNGIKLFAHWRELGAKQFESQVGHRKSFRKATLRPARRASKPERGKQSGRRVQHAARTLRFG